jgi:hypothetical protein
MIFIWRNNMNFKLILAILISIPLFSTAANQDRDKQVLQRLKVDIAELKGPPSVEQVINKQKESADDLLLVINSGRYEGKRLDYLKEMHKKMLKRPLLTQEEINEKHRAMINQQKKDRPFKNKNMRKKEMMLNKKRKNMRRKQDSK